MDRLLGREAQPRAVAEGMIMIKSRVGVSQFTAWTWRHRTAAPCPRLDQKTTFEAVPCSAVTS